MTVATTDKPAARESRRRKVFAILNEARLTHRDDRIMLASALLNERIESMSALSDEHLRDLAGALQDWRTVEEARRATGVYTVAALEHILSLDIPDEARTALIRWCTDLGLEYQVATGSEADATSTLVGSPDDQWRIAT